VTIYRILTFFAGFILIINCSGNKNSRKFNLRKESKLISPAIEEKYIEGDSIEFAIATNNLEIDSVLVRTRLDTVISRNKSFKIPSTNLIGKPRIILDVHFDQRKETHYPKIMVLPSRDPIEYGFRIINTYDHQVSASTQGLIFHNGYLIEGTGKRGESSLRKVELSSGNVLKSIALDNQYFGEGVTLYKDRIYQLTWRKNVGFIYNLDFELIEQFNYPTQGWGLTTIGERILMSDGSENLYYVKPQNFIEVDKIQVYDTHGPVVDLNELEFINGKVYANVFQENYIVIIDPKSGRVEGKINLTELVESVGKLDHPDEVLNGITYHPDRETLLVTGKRWPKLFEIKIFKK